MTFGISLFQLNCVSVTAVKRNILKGGFVLLAASGFYKDIFTLMPVNIMKD